MADLAARYAALVFPSCPNCKGDNVKLVLKGYPTAEILQYSMTSTSRVMLSSSHIPGKYMCFDCEKDF